MGRESSTSRGSLAPAGRVFFVDDNARTPEELTAANAVASTVDSIATFVGPALGGLLLGLASTSVVSPRQAQRFMEYLALQRLGEMRPERRQDAGPEIPEILIISRLRQLQRFTGYQRPALIRPELCQQG